MTIPRWDRHSILAHMRRRGMTLTGLAERYGLSTSGVKNIWTRPNEPAERAIADFLEEPVEKVFPDRYPKTRNRIFKPEFGSTSSRKATSDKDRRAVA
ncbi:helix-turn-helix domain-containing protein [Nitratireductor sp. B36]|uniref:helix-turn-helix domain-containing protein n=1 Tax=Nitratireductor sp. B36 TaxID=2762059 RepID=UPI001E2FDEDC|nr:helix-turn-helix transcriptional regulator [Nitratireductor sp. B36]MCC5780788.1 helix-turn-helix domain-containing protein [Nitratireductor sp. B36]